MNAMKNTTSSSEPGIYMMFRYAANCMWLLTYASMPSTTPITAELPAHMPSMPSLRLAPLETAVTTKMVMMTKRIHPPAVLYLPKKPTISE